MPVTAWCRHVPCRGIRHARSALKMPDPRLRGGGRKKETTEDTESTEKDLKKLRVLSVLCG